MKSKRMRWAGHVAYTGYEKRITIMVVKQEGKTSLGRPRYRWEDNIRRDLIGTGWQTVNRIHLPLIGSSGGL
jgi:hypothetical protein